MVPPMRSADPEWVHELWDAISHRGPNKVMNYKRVKALMAKSSLKFKKDQGQLNMQLQMALKDGLVVATRTGSGENRETIYSLPDVSTFEKGDRDWYCFECHKPEPGPVALCVECPRVYHMGCLSIEDMPRGPFTCPSCRILAARTSCQGVPVEQQVALLQYTCNEFKMWKNRILERADGRNWASADKRMEAWRFDLLIYQQPVGLDGMIEKVSQAKYASLEEFLVDVEILAHAMLVYFGEEMKEFAKAILDTAKRDVKDIQYCPECFIRSNEAELKKKKKEKNDWWFCLPCKVPHEVVWVKRKNSAYWPAKVIFVKGNDNQKKYDVRYFGGSHEREIINGEKIFSIEKMEIDKKKFNRGKGWREACDEMAKFQEVAKDPGVFRNLPPQEKSRRRRRRPASRKDKTKPGSTMDTEEGSPTAPASGSIAGGISPTENELPVTPARAPVVKVGGRRKRGASQSSEDIVAPKVGKTAKKRGQQGGQTGIQLAAGAAAAVEIDESQPAATPPNPGTSTSGGTPIMKKIAETPTNSAGSRKPAAFKSSDEEDIEVVFVGEVPTTKRAEAAQAVAAHNGSPSGSTGVTGNARVVPPALSPRENQQVTTTRALNINQDPEKIQGTKPDILQEKAGKRQRATSPSSQEIADVQVVEGEKESGKTGENSAQQFGAAAVGKRPRGVQSSDGGDGDDPGKVVQNQEKRGEVGDNSAPCVVASAAAAGTGEFQPAATPPTPTPGTSASAGGSSFRKQAETSTNSGGSQKRATIESSDGNDDLFIVYDEGNEAAPELGLSDEIGESQPVAASPTAGPSASAATSCINDATASPNPNAALSGGGSPSSGSMRGSVTRPRTQAGERKRGASQRSDDGDPVKVAKNQGSVCTWNESIGQITLSAVRVFRQSEAAAAPPTPGTSASAGASPFPANSNPDGMVQRGFPSVGEEGTGTGTPTPVSGAVPQGQNKPGFSRALNNNVGRQSGAFLEEIETINIEIEVRDGMNGTLNSSNGHSNRVLQAEGSVSSPSSSSASRATTRNNNDHDRATHQRGTNNTSNITMKDAILSIKKQNWCSHPTCERKATMNCCWLGRYCSTKCQEEHWRGEDGHKAMCCRKEEQEKAAAEVAERRRREAEELGRNVSWPG